VDLKRITFGIVPIRPTPGTVAAFSPQVCYCKNGIVNNERKENKKTPVVFIGFGGGFFNGLDSKRIWFLSLGLDII
jgi:hypothetical protein